METIIFNTIIQSSLDLVKSIISFYVKTDSSTVNASIIGFVSAVFSLFSIANYEKFKIYLKNKNFKDYMKKYNTKDNSVVIIYDDDFFINYPRENCTLSNEQYTILKTRFFVDVKKSSCFFIYKNYVICAFSGTQTQIFTLQKEEITPILSTIIDKIVEHLNPIYSSKTIVKKENLYAYQFHNPESISVINKKSFDTIVCKESIRLKKFIEQFVSGDIITRFNGYAPNNIGVILTGPPGTGKSSVISAIANYTGRNILVVDLKRVQSAVEFEQIITGKHKNPNNGSLYSILNTIFVFEELDCVPSVISRTLEVDEKKEDKNDLLQIQTRMIEEGSKNCKTTEDLIKLTDYLKETHKNNQTNTNNKLSLSDILTLLDGVANVDQRIILATTNHPEKIDKALLRPGRFDLIIKMDFLDNDEINELLTRIFKNTKFSKKEIVTNKKITAAELINLSIQLGSYENVIKHFQN